MHEAMTSKLVAVYILSGINYSIINYTRGASACFKCAMLYTEEELKKMKVKDSITMDMEHLNFSEAISDRVYIINKRVDEAY